MRKLLVCMIIVGLMGALATTALGQEKLSLRMSVIGAPGEMEPAQELVDAFLASRPDLAHVKIIVEAKPGDQEMIIQAAAGTLPDIVWLCDVLVELFARNDVVIAMDEYLANSVTPGFDLDDIYPGMLALGTFDGKVYMLPRSLDVIVALYNKDLFDEAGVAYPQADWDYDDFLTIAKELTKVRADGVQQYGVDLIYDWWSIWVPFVRQAGGRVSTPDGKTATLDTPEAFQGLHNLVDLVTVHGVAPSPEAKGTVPGGNLFQAGLAAMAQGVRGQIPSYRAQCDFDWDVQVLYSGPVRESCGMGCSGYGVSITTQDAQICTDFVAYITSPPGQRVFIKGYGAVPVLMSMADDPAYTRLPGPPYNIPAFTDKAQYGEVPPVLPIQAAGEVNQLLKEALEICLLGRGTVEEVFANFTHRINEILAEVE